MAHIGLPIFLDLKLHDIPNTVAKAVQSLGPLAPAILTVHASGGRAMLEDAKAAAPTGTKVVAVTMLTSLDANDLSDTGVTGSPADHVRRLADLAAESGWTASSVRVPRSRQCARRGPRASSWCRASVRRMVPSATRSAW
jgi:orotidine-5'-phosphate decarboxylase